MPKKNKPRLKALELSASESFPSPRSRLLAVIGTDTEIGKSVVTASLARTMTQMGLNVGVFKPFASDPAKRRSGGYYSTDAALLARAVGRPKGGAEATGQHFHTPLSPLAAAEIEKREVDFELAIRQARELTARYDLTLVEGCGGWEVPLTRKLTTADYFQALGAPVVIVSRTTLGTINHSLLTLQAVARRGLKVEGIILNRTQIGRVTLAEETNPPILAAFAHVPIWGPLPYKRSLSRKRIDTIPVESLHDMRSIAHELLVKLHYA
jgi:dethiobiotin synthetase